MFFPGFDAWADVLERMFVYYPTKQISADPSSIGLPFVDVYPTTSDGLKIHGWFIPKPGARLTFLVFHGNGGNISDRLDWIAILHELNAQVLAVDYRGYGRSEGIPCEPGLYLDATAAYDWWQTESGCGSNRLVVIGESLGGAVAVDLAARVRVNRLVLQSTFSSARDVARTLVPFGILHPFTKVRFDSAEKIKGVDCPKLFIHGDRDDLVPFELGQKLYKAAPPPKDFYRVAGANHNDLLAAAGTEYVNRMAAFLS